MKKKLTLLIFDATGTPVRQAAIPKILFPITILFLMGALIALYWGITDYRRLKAASQQVGQLKTDLHLQEETIAHQKDQINTFAQKIDALSTQLASLHEFENKIRVIANIEPNDGSSSMFGVGGSDPEDVGPEALIANDHEELVRDMHVRINALDDDAHLQQNAFASIFTQLEGKRNQLAATPSIKPVDGWISSRFGYRESPFTGRREFHRGIDIATHHGTKIIAPADGIITYSGKKGLMGNMLTVDHGFGMVTRYGHISKFLKKKGERVKRGEVIALVGNTGRSTGPHLHYEVKLNGLAVNPSNYFLN
jgi:murein DD-endopeptidase MepM/ murein hydrolase activator NlpD